MVLAIKLDWVGGWDFVYVRCVYINKFSMTNANYYV